MAYTYNDFVTAANSAGLLQSFSSADLATAQKSPEFGISLLSLKQDYAKASTPEAKTLAHSAAEALRESYGNYSGGAGGDDYIAKGATTLGSPGRGSDELDSLLNEIKNYGSFSYDPESDENYAALKKLYLREADRTTEDTMGEAAAMTGGIPSTAAVTAASQAGDYQKTQLADKIPTLEQNAYGEWADTFNRLVSAYSAQKDKEDTDYEKLMEQIDGSKSRNAAQSETDSTAGWTMLKSGVMPSAAQLTAMGITGDQASEYLAAASAAAGSGTGDGDPGTGGHVLNGKTLTDAQYASYEAMTSGSYTAADFAAIVQSGAYTADQLTKAGYSASGSSADNDPVITNNHADTWVYISGHGRYSYQELKALVESGKVKETFDKAKNTLAYTWA